MIVLPHKVGILDITARGIFLILQSDPLNLTFKILNSFPSYSHNHSDKNQYQAKVSRAFQNIVWQHINSLVSSAINLSCSFPVFFFFFSTKTPGIVQPEGFCSHCVSVWEPESQVFSWLVPSFLGLSANVTLSVRTFLIFPNNSYYFTQ